MPIPTACQIKVAEQNFLNQQWPGNYARRIAVVRKDGQYWLLDAYLLGWKHLISSPKGQAFTVSANI